MFGSESGIKTFASIDVGEGSMLRVVFGLRCESSSGMQCIILNTAR